MNEVVNVVNAGGCRVGCKAKEGRYTGGCGQAIKPALASRLFVCGEKEKEKEHKRKWKATDILNTNKYKACFRSGSFIKNQFGKRFVRMKTNSTRLSVHAQMMDKGVPRAEFLQVEFLQIFFATREYLVTCKKNLQVTTCMTSFKSDTALRKKSFVA